MSKFVYGSLPRQLRLVGYLPGQITSAFGPRYVAAGIVSEGSDQVEFGEIVEILDNTAKGYVVGEIDANTDTVNTVAVVVRDVVGRDATGGGITAIPKRNVPLSLFVASEHNLGKVVAFLGEANDVPGVGNAVYVGIGTNNTVQGAVYVNDSNDVGSTPFVFASTKFAPTTNPNAYAVQIQVDGTDFSG